MTTPTPSTSEEQPLTPEELKNYRKFFSFWIGQKISYFGSEVVQFVLTWWITATTGNAFYLSLGMFLTFAPRVLLGPLAGVLADKLDRKKLIAITDALQAVATLVLIILISLVELNVWFILGFNAIRAIFQSFHGPASATVTPLMVPQQKLSKINGLDQLFLSILNMIAPVIGALLYDEFILAHILWIDIITFGIALALLLSISFPQIQEPDATPTTHETRDTEDIPITTPATSKEGLMHNFMEGIRVLKTIPGLVSLFSLMVVANFLLSPFNVLITLFVNDIHGFNSSQYAILAIFIEAGMIIGSLLPTLKKKWKRPTLVIMVAIILVFGGIYMMALSPTGDLVWMSICGFTITLLLPVAMTLFMTVIQKTIPIAKMGRVFSFFQALNSASMMIGYLLAGSIAEIVGIVPLYQVSSIIGMIVSLGLFMFTSMRKMDAVINEEQPSSSIKPMSATS